MSELLGLQTSRNDWSMAGPLIIHESVQEMPFVWRPESQSTTLESLEAEMAHYEREYAANLEDLRKLYVVPNDESVHEFLNSHRAFPQILIEAEPHLRKYFPEAVFALRATCDEYGWDNLYVSVLWPGEASEAFRLLDQFGDDWWIAKSRPARGALTFTYRLV